MESRLRKIPQRVIAIASYKTHCLYVLNDKRILQCNVWMNAQTPSKHMLDSICEHQRGTARLLAAQPQLHHFIPSARRKITLAASESDVRSVRNASLCLLVHIFHTYVALVHQASSKHWSDTWMLPMLRSILYWRNVFSLSFLHVCIAVVWCEWSARILMWCDVPYMSSIDAWRRKGSQLGGIPEIGRVCCCVQRENNVATYMGNDEARDLIGGKLMYVALMCMLLINDVWHWEIRTTSIRSYTFSVYNQV